MAAGLYPAFQFFDNNGEPLNGGLVYTFAPGTTTPKASYQDAALSVPHANPIVLSAFGRPPAPIWLDGETKVVVKTALGDTLDTVDNVNADVGGLGGWATKGDGVLLRSAAYDITPADDGKTIVATAGSWTLGTAEPAAAMSDGFVVDFFNAGPDPITFDPNGSETADGKARIVFGKGDGARIVCDGANWRVLRTQNIERPTFRNRLINGDMSIDQRNAGAVRTLTSGNFYSLDRWTVHGAAGIANVSVQRLSAAGGGDISPWYARLLRSAGTYTGTAILSQAIERVNCFDMAGKNFVLTFRARCGSGYSAASLRMSASVRSGTVADEGIGGMTAGTWTGFVIEANSTFGLTTDWQTFTLTGGIQAGALEVGVMLVAGSFVGTGSANDYVDITDVQLEIGEVATEFEREEYTERIRKCQRYFCKSYDLGTIPGAVSSNGYLGVTGNGGGGSVAPIQLPVSMRVTPAVTAYNHATGASGTWRDGGASDRAVTITGQGQRGFTVACSTVAVNSTIGGHYTASAEL